ncbi:BON domain-containing protein [Limibaculum sp. M0105]|uniref:BON domain-containing protein n=1 Tax=Thermohalobaculum xanthum TaxID=2753746 RepID=A0A8J7SFZ7_9RHOB|nr:BON domain-containing protein [Thermohalobaculum xanthum]MBK0400486.1 BON domain-containing protein [Thermohalobaculum xanthum]
MKSYQAAATLALCACVASGCAPVAVIGTSTVVAHSVAQERTTFDALTDTEIEISLANRLANHSGELYRDVSVDVIEGRVVLTGSVPRREDKVTATRIAWETPSVVEVTDELTVKGDSGTGAYIDDVAISNRVRYELFTDLNVRSINFNVETVDGVVHLTGLARSQRELERVVNHARSVNGVKRVVSHILTIDDPRRRVAARKAPAQAETPQVPANSAPVTETSGWSGTGNASTIEATPLPGATQG